jgi:hypothetical protein
MILILLSLSRINLVSSHQIFDTAWSQSCISPSSKRKKSGEGASKKTSIHTNLLCPMICFLYEIETLIATHSLV